MRSSHKLMFTNKRGWAARQGLITPGNSKICTIYSADGCPPHNIDGLTQVHYDVLSFYSNAAPTWEQWAAPSITGGVSLPVQDWVTAGGRQAVLAIQLAPTQAIQARTVTDGVIASGSLTTLSSATAAFVPADVGRAISDTGNTHIPSGTTISAYISDTQVGLSNTGSAVTGDTVTIAGDPIWYTTGAGGAYDTYATQWAEFMVSKGWGNAVLRIAVEMNGAHFIDGIPSGTSGQADWATFWGRMVAAMKAVPGANFLYCWDPLAAYQAIDFDNYWPGDQYVDIVGIDQYDGFATGGSHPPPGDPTRFALLAAQPQGLDDITAFAKTHHKTLALCEWGLNQPGTDPQDPVGGDDPLYVEGIAQWSYENDVAFQAYFNVSEGTYTLGDPAIPKSTAAYINAFSI